MQYVKTGWKTTKHHFYIVIFLFLYQLLWGFFLYRFVDSVVFPILRRYPNAHPSKSAVSMFYAESQFQLMKTDLIDFYAWMLLGLFVLRMVLTPFINAGLYYSIHHAEPKSGTLFLKGIQRTWKTTFLFYLIQMAAVIAPAYWAVPYAFKLYLGADSQTSLLIALLPIAAAWLVYGYMLQLILLYVQFGKVAQLSLFRSIGLSLRHLLPMIGLSLLLLLISGIAALLTASVSLIWAGLIALVLHQVYHLFRSLFKVWQIAAQYHLWSSKSGIGGIRP